MTRRLRRFLVRAAIVYGAAFTVVSCSGVASRLLLFPSRGSLAVPGAERVLLPSEAGGLEVFVGRDARARGGDLRAYVLKFCGNADRAERRVEDEVARFGGRGVEVWAVNYPGFGGSAGAPELAALAPAGLAAFDALQERAQGRPILVSGSSMGSTVALFVAAERTVAGLILENPPPLRRMIVQRHGWWNLWLLALPVAAGVPRAINALDTAPRVRAPAVFLMAEGDQTVPPDYQRLVLEAYAGEKAVIALPGGHNDGLNGAALELFRQSLDRTFGMLFR